MSFIIKSDTITKFELQNRTKAFYIGVIKLCEHFPKNAAGFETAKQLIRSGGSVGANYRAACRGKSKADFIYKIEIVLEEADESLYWLEVTKSAELIKSNQSDQLDCLIKEANELVSIFTATDMTAKRNRDQPNPKITKSQNQK
ncbi:MAG TPA: four helix bundle protein [Chitinophagaceae bacterium]|nr:four helix bundle protein [Chitinophagaceae bacterium]